MCSDNTSVPSKEKDIVLDTQCSILIHTKNIGALEKQRHITYGGFVHSEMHQLSQIF